MRPHDLHAGWYPVTAPAHAALRYIFALGAPEARIQLATRRAQYDQLRRVQPISIALMLLGALLWAITGRDIFGLIGLVAGAVAGMVIQFRYLAVRASVRCPTCRSRIGQDLYAPGGGGGGTELPEQAA